MSFSLETLAALATILGTVVSIVALLQSRDWIMVTSFVVVSLSIAAILYARGKRLALDAASTIIEGNSIDSLNIANLRRRVNRTFTIQEAHHTVRIKGADMEIEWKYSGFCRTKFETAMEFSIDSEGGIPFDRLGCVAFDLENDPGMKHAISPVLIGSGSISKKISVPFLKPLKANAPFSVLLKCTLPRCVTAGFGYYTCTLSFAQTRVRRCVVHLIFEGANPSWVRVYESTLQHPARLLKSLPSSHQKYGTYEYIDDAEDRPGQSARIYAFWRDSSRAL